MTDIKGSSSGVTDFHTSDKQWDDISCPICMDHPHNAVLIICSSHDKGCRSYICDTSYRHSNCLDRFKKAKENNSIVVEQTEGNNNNQEERIVPEVDLESLKCPLCRGNVLKWVINKEARQYLDLKPRSCSRESCSFSGNYRELRRHARRIHPTTRPTDVDPSRQRSWHRLEDQREYEDVLSAIRSSMPGAIVLGDFVIDSGDALPRDRDNIGMPTMFFLQMFGNSSNSRDDSRVSSRTWRTHRRSGSHRRSLWSENDDEDRNLDEDIPIPRRRRRFMRSRPDEEQP